MESRVLITSSAGFGYGVQEITVEGCEELRRVMF
jgi:hypothetical protein